MEQAILFVNHLFNLDWKADDIGQFVYDQAKVFAEMDGFKSDGEHYSQAVLCQVVMLASSNKAVRVKVDKIESNEAVTLAKKIVEKYEDLYVKLLYKAGLRVNSKTVR